MTNTPNNRAQFQTAADVLATWRDDVLTGQPPVLYPVGAGELSRVEIGPGRVLLMGGAPGSGKTALVMQCVIDALRMTPTLRALVCNVEMSAEVLLDRQLARLSGIDLTTIRFRKFSAEHADRLDQGLNTLDALGERLCFVRAPFSLSNVAATADSFGADVIVLDYIQRVAPPGQHGDRRGSVDACMNYLRQFADAGIALIVVAAVARTKDSGGRSSYDGEGLNLASFRESSELEFGADDAFILVPNGVDAGMTLRHLKARHGECRDLPLTFDRPLQRFTPTAAIARNVKERSRGTRRKLHRQLSALWDRTAAAADDLDAEVQS